MHAWMDGKMDGWMYLLEATWPKWKDLPKDDDALTKPGILSWRSLSVVFPKGHQSLSGENATGESYVNM